MSPRALVTGASGHVGRAVIAAAPAAGLSVSAADRGGRAVDGAPGVHFDFRDRGTWASALDGHDRLFLLRPPAIADVRDTLLPFIDVALRAGIDHVVFLSVAGADRNRFLPHRAVEDRLRASGIGHTVLRPGFFAQNLESAYRDDIRDRDRLYVPAGHAPVAWIDVRDIGEVAASILAGPEVHRGAAYTLTGAAPVAWEAVAAALSRATGRRIRYVPASIPGYALHLARRGLPAGAIAVQTVLHVLLRFGRGSGVDPTLGRLLGRAPRGIEAYVEQNAALWR